MCHLALRKCTVIKQVTEALRQSGRCWRDTSSAQPGRRHHVPGASESAGKGLQTLGPIEGAWLIVYC